MKRTGEVMYDGCPDGLDMRSNSSTMWNRVVSSQTRHDNDPFFRERAQLARKEWKRSEGGRRQGSVFLVTGRKRRWRLLACNTY